MKPSNLVILTLLAFLCGCAGRNAWNLTAGQHPERFHIRHSTLNEQFLLYLPAGYGQENKSWPLLMFLHGSGECGTDLARVKVHGPPEIADSLSDFPFIVVTPQALQDTPWSVSQLHTLLSKVIRRLQVDKDRIYLTGLSMGGRGSW